MVQFIFLKCNWRKGAKSIPKANLRCNFKLRVDFQESDKYLQRTRAHVRSSVLRWLGHLENSTASQPPTELRTRICTTRIKLLRTGLGPEVWGELAHDREMAVAAERVMRDAPIPQEIINGIWDRLEYADVTMEQARRAAERVRG